MKVVYTDAALQDLDEIADWLTAHYPAIAPRIEQPIRDVVYGSAGGRRSRPALRRVPVCGS
jgi:plasmid stabilization system protein ParE